MRQDLGGESDFAQAAGALKCKMSLIDVFLNPTP